MAESLSSAAGVLTEAVPPSVVLEECPCPLACSRGDLEVAEGFDRMFGCGGPFRVLRCRGCGLMRTSPRPNLATIGMYYPDQYAPYADFPTERWRSPLRRLLIRLRLDGTRELVPNVPPGAALEIGCASGMFMKKLRRRGWSVQGIEPSVSAARVAEQAGFAVHIGPVETAPDFGERFDLIVASHSIEHLHEPLTVLRQLRRWARPGAQLSLAVPNAASLLFRLFRGAWYDLDLPRHLFHFTPRTMTAMLNVAGWDVINVRAQRTLNSVIGSVGHWFTDWRGTESSVGASFLGFPNSQSPFKALTLPLAAGLSLIGETGRMIVSARAGTLRD